MNIDTFIAEIEEASLRPEDLQEWEACLKTIITQGKTSNSADIVNGALSFINYFINWTFSNLDDIRENFSYSSSFFRTLQDLIFPRFSKELFAKSKYILDIILEDHVKYYVIKKELLQFYYVCARNMTPNLRRKVAHELTESYLFKLIDLMSILSDYDFQVLIIEVTYCLYGKNALNRHCNNLIPESQDLSEKFVHISEQSFFDDVRAFLQDFNEVSGKVFSILCPKVILGVTICSQTVGSDEGLWVNINILDATMSWNCSKICFSPSLKDDNAMSEFQSIILLMRDVRNITVNTAPDQSSLIIIMDLSRPCICTANDCQPFVDVANKLTLFIKESPRARKLISNILPSLLSGRKISQKTQYGGNSKGDNSKVSKVSTAYDPLRISIVKKTEARSNYSTPSCRQFGLVVTMHSNSYNESDTSILLNSTTLRHSDNDETFTQRKFSGTKRSKSSSSSEDNFETANMDEIISLSSSSAVSEALLNHQENMERIHVLSSKVFDTKKNISKPVSISNKMRISKPLQNRGLNQMEIILEDTTEHDEHVTEIKQESPEYFETAQATEYPSQEITSNLKKISCISSQDSEIPEAAVAKVTRPKKKTSISSQKLSSDGAESLLADAGSSQETFALSLNNYFQTAPTKLRKTSCNSLSTELPSLPDKKISTCSQKVESDGAESLVTNTGSLQETLKLSSPHKSSNLINTVADDDNDGETSEKNTVASSENLKISKKINKKPQINIIQNIQIRSPESSQKSKECNSDNRLLTNPSNPPLVTEEEEGETISQLMEKPHLKSNENLSPVVAEEEEQEALHVVIEDSKVTVNQLMRKAHGKSSQKRLPVVADEKTKTISELMKKPHWKSKGKHFLYTKEVFDQTTQSMKVVVKKDKNNDVEKSQSSQSKAQEKRLEDEEENNKSDHVLPAAEKINVKDAEPYSQEANREGTQQSSVSITKKISKASHIGGHIRELFIKLIDHSKHTPPSDISEDTCCYLPSAALSTNVNDILLMADENSNQLLPPLQQPGDDHQPSRKKKSTTTDESLQKLANLCESQNGKISVVMQKSFVGTRIRRTRIREDASIDVKRNVVAKDSVRSGRIEKKAAAVKPKMTRKRVKKVCSDASVEEGQVEAKEIVAGEEARENNIVGTIDSNEEISKMRTKKVNKFVEEPMDCTPELSSQKPREKEASETDIVKVALGRKKAIVQEMEAVKCVVEAMDYSVVLSKMKPNEAKVEKKKAADLLGDAGMTKMKSRRKKARIDDTVEEKKADEYLKDIMDHSKETSKMKTKKDEVFVDDNIESITAVQTEDENQNKEMLNIGNGPTKSVVANLLMVVDNHQINDDLDQEHITDEVVELGNTELPKQPLERRIDTSVEGDSAQSSQEDLEQRSEIIRKQSLQLDFHQMDDRDDSNQEHIVVQSKESDDLDKIVSPKQSFGTRNTSVEDEVAQSSSKSTGRFKRMKKQAKKVVSQQTEESSEDQEATVLESNAQARQVDPQQTVEDLKEQNDIIIQSMEAVELGKMELPKQPSGRRDARVDVEGSQSCSKATGSFKEMMKQARLVDSHQTDDDLEEQESIIIKSKRRSGKMKKQTKQVDLHQTNAALEEAGMIIKSTEAVDLSKIVSPKQHVRRRDTSVEGNGALSPTKTLRRSERMHKQPSDLEQESIKSKTPGRSEKKNKQVRQIDSQQTDVELEHQECSIIKSKEYVDTALSPVNKTLRRTQRVNKQVDPLQTDDDIVPKGLINKSKAPWRSKRIKKQIMQVNSQLTIEDLDQDGIISELKPRWRSEKLKKQARPDNLRQPDVDLDQNNQLTEGAELKKLASTNKPSGRRDTDVESDGAQLPPKAPGKSEIRQVQHDPHKVQKHLNQNPSITNQPFGEELDEDFERDSDNEPPMGTTMQSIRNQIFDGLKRSYDLTMENKQLETSVDKNAEVDDNEKTKENIFERNDKHEKADDIINWMYKSTFIRRTRDKSLKLNEISGENDSVVGKMDKSKNVKDKTLEQIDMMEQDDTFIAKRICKPGNIRKPTDKSIKQKDTVKKPMATLHNKSMKYGGKRNKQIAHQLEAYLATDSLAASKLDENPDEINDKTPQVNRKSEALLVLKRKWKKAMDDVHISDPEPVSLRKIQKVRMLRQLMKEEKNKLLFNNNNNRRDVRESDGNNATRRVHRAIVNQPAPEWKCLAFVDNADEPTSSSEYLGKYLVIYFFPFNGKHLPKDLLDLNEKIVKFNDFNANVLACPCSSGSSHSRTSVRSKWYQQSQPRNNEPQQSLPIPLLLDSNKSVARAFNVYLKDGRYRCRHIIVVDPKGILMWSSAGYIKIEMILDYLHMLPNEI